MSNCSFCVFFYPKGVFFEALLGLPTLPILDANWIVFGHDDESVITNGFELVNKDAKHLDPF